MRKNYKAMTLMEIIIVIVIIGILSMAGVVGYRQTMLNARDREAQAMLRLIKHAADVWRVEMGFYVSPTNPLVSVGCGNTGACNATLRLNLADPAPADTVWIYSVRNVAANSFCTQAAAGQAGQGAGFHINRNVTTGVDDSNLNPLPAGGC